MRFAFILCDKRVWPYVSFIPSIFREVSVANPVELTRIFIIMMSLEWYRSLSVVTEKTVALAGLNRDVRTIAEAVMSITTTIMARTRVFFCIQEAIFRVWS